MHTPTLFVLGLAASVSASGYLSPRAAGASILEARIAAPGPQQCAGGPVIHQDADYGQSVGDRINGGGNDAGSTGGGTSTEGTLGDHGGDANNGNRDVGQQGADHNGQNDNGNNGNNGGGGGGGGNRDNNGGQNSDQNRDQNNNNNNNDQNRKSAGSKMDAGFGMLAGMIAATVIIVPEIL